MSNTVEIAEGLHAHPSGALWIPTAGTILIADAHLGYGWAQRRRGELGPVRDDVAAQKVNTVLDELQPAEVVFLGDVVHAPRPGVEERSLIEALLRSLATRTKLTIVRGNHDRGFLRDFKALGIPFVDEWAFGDVRALHGDKPIVDQSSRIVVGHLHPSLTIADAAGAKQRVPIFLVSDRRVVLPAFSPFAAGYDIARGLGPEWGITMFDAYAGTGRRVVRIAPRLLSGRTGRASEWR